MSDTVSPIKSDKSFFYFLPSAGKTTINVAVLAIAAGGAYLALSNPTSLTLSTLTLTWKNVALTSATLIALRKLLPASEKPVIVVALMTIASVGVYLAVSNPSFILNMPALTFKNVSLTGGALLALRLLLPSSEADQVLLGIALVAITGLGVYLLLSNPNTSSALALGSKYTIVGGIGISTLNSLYLTYRQSKRYRVLSEGHSRHSSTGMRMGQAVKRESLKLNAETIKEALAKKISSPWGDTEYVMSKDRIRDLIVNHPDMLKPVIDAISDQHERIAEVLELMRRDQFSSDQPDRIAGALELMRSNQSPNGTSNLVKFISILRDQNILIPVLGKSSWYEQDKLSEYLQSDEIDALFEIKFQNSNQYGTIDNTLKNYLDHWFSTNQLADQKDSDAVFKSLDELFTRISKASLGTSFQDRVRYALVVHLAQLFDSQGSSEVIEKIVQLLNTHFIVSENEPMDPSEFKFNQWGQPFFFLYRLRRFEGNDAYSALLKNIAGDMIDRFKKPEELGYVLSFLKDDKKVALFTSMNNKIQTIGLDKLDGKTSLFLYHLYQLEPDLSNQYFGDLSPTRTIFGKVCWNNQISIPQRDEVSTSSSSSTHA